jgi:predicted O-methyltransferase YrrM
VLYALTRRALGPALATYAAQPVTLVDIGTAKGFSALCLEWARRDSGLLGRVVSLDVIDPAARRLRNTIADCDGPKTLAELLAPWPEAEAIEFRHEPADAWLARSTDRVVLAFVDGKHTREAVTREGVLLSARQQPGDLAVFDDLQLPPVAAAVADLATAYDFRYVLASPARIYAIGTRR